VPVKELIGGAERVCHDIARSLDPGRFHVVGTALRADPPDVIRSLSEAVDALIVWGIKDWPERVFGERSERSANDRRTPAVVLTAHGSGHWAADSVSRASEADALVAVGDACVAPFPESERNRVRVIANMVDPERVRPSRSREDVREEWCVPDDAIVALFLGRLSGEKRPRTAVEAASAEDGLYVVLHGRAASPGEAEALADLAAITPGARIFPQAEDVGSALHAADCLILPSETEGCSLAGLEAHLAGLPVIATPVGLYSRNPGLARLVPAMCSPEELRQAILDDAEDWHGTKVRAADAKAYIWEFHDPADFKAGWESVIASVAPPPKVGDAFASRAERYGLKAGSCGCGATRRRMNELGPDGCERQFDSLVTEVVANARAGGYKAPRLAEAGAAYLPEAVLAVPIRLALRRAIRDARGRAGNTGLIRRPGRRMLP
jgi:glycosyltransferase involved in cell wall biosynthesis